MRLIDFEKARKEVLAVLAGKVNTVIAIKVVEALKKATIEAEPVRHGRWEEESQNSAYYGKLVSCSECGAFLDPKKVKAYRFCYNCGAKMDLEGRL